MMTHWLRPLWLALSLSILITLSVGATEVTFGPEFEFTSKAFTKEFYEGGGKQQVTFAMEKLHQKIAAKCAAIPGCKSTERMMGKFGRTEYRITMQDGAWFQLAIDPGCIEVTAKPMTVTEWRANQKVFEDLIFATARQEGLSIDDTTTHHINFGLKSAFDDDPEAFLRFYADYANHPDLALGGLGSDPKNGAPLSLLDLKQRDGLKAVITEFESGKHQSIPKLVEQIKLRVHTKIFYEPFNKNASSLMHYQALGLKHILGDTFGDNPPIEIRSVWAKNSIDEFIKTLEVIEARIKLLNSMKGQPILYLGIDKKSYFPAEIVSRLHAYISDSGLDLERYRFLLRDIYRDVPVDPLFRDHAPLDRRLQNLVKDYPDLLDTSPMTRALGRRLATDALQNPDTAVLGQQVLAMIQATDRNHIPRPKVIKPPSAVLCWIKNLGRLLVR